MFSAIEHLLFGSPLPTQNLSDERLNKVRALASLSPDALSSIAYANQEIYLGLVVAGSAGLSMSWTIGLAITALLGMVAISYFQTIHGYPSGGGSYIVARENLGVLARSHCGCGIVGRLPPDCGSEFDGRRRSHRIGIPRPMALPHRSCAISPGHHYAHQPARRARDRHADGHSGLSLPVHLPADAGLGGLQLLGSGPASLSPAAPPATEPLTLLLVLHAFSSGCTALTGIEAISNGVPNFRSPQAKNAGRTLIVMAALMGVLFLGSIGLTQFLAIVAGPEETILSALARRLLGNGPAYLIIQISTLLILAVAANTSFTDFPRVAAILARDGFLPRQLTNLGDRLVFNNGIVLLATATGVLIVLFGGDTHALVPLFAVGAFLAFTLSQAGMVVHWWRKRERRWLLKASANGVGALATAVTLFIVGASKFVNGAWIAILLIPVLVAVFMRIRAHYQQVAHQLSLKHTPTPFQRLPSLRAVVPISGVHRGDVDAVNFACSISQNVTAVYIELEIGAGQKIREEWAHWWPEVPLVIVPSPYRSIVGPLLNFLDETDKQQGDGQLAAVVLPEFVPARWWQALLHNQTAWLIKTALLYHRRRLGFQRVIIDVPYHLKR